MFALGSTLAPCKPILNLLRGVGLRELTTGVGLLSKSRPAAWAWARLAGDVMDLALLGYVWQRNGVSRERMLGVGGTVLGAAWADAQTAIELQRAQLNPLADGIRVKQTVTVQKTPEEAYSFFRDLENLPRFMSHLESVVETNGRSRWRAKGPLGMNIEWAAEIMDDRPGELIAWRSLPGADVPHHGQVSFRPAPGGLATEIGVYGGLIDNFPMGAVVNRSLTIRAGQCHVQRYMRPLLEHIERGDIDPSFVVTHTLPLSQAARGYEMFLGKHDHCERSS